MGKTTNRCRLGCAAAIAGLLACAAIPLHAQAPAVPAATVAPSADPLRPVWQPGESRVMRAWQVRAVAAPLPDEANLRASADWPANVAWSDLLDLSATAFAVNGSPIGRKFVYAEAVISRDTAGPAELAVSAGGGSTPGSTARRSAPSRQARSSVTRHDSRRGWKRARTESCFASRAMATGGSPHAYCLLGNCFRRTAISRRPFGSTARPSSSDPTSRRRARRRPFR